MNIRRNLILSALVTVWCGWAETTVLKNFTLIDGASAKPLPNAAMIVVDGRIQWVGPSASLKAPAGAQTLDLAGKFVMPGIINLHGHLGNTVDLAQDPKNFTRANVEKQLKSQIENFFAYPTTLFSDRKGKVRAIHWGFQGPGTGDRYPLQVRKLHDLAQHALQ